MAKRIEAGIEQVGECRRTAGFEDFALLRRYCAKFLYERTYSGEVPGRAYRPLRVAAQPATDCDIAPRNASSMLILDSIRALSPRVQLQSANEQEPIDSKSTVRNTGAGRGSVAELLSYGHVDREEISGRRGWRALLTAADTEIEALLDA